MNHINILKRSLNITVNYRVLWIFGILLALTVGGSGGGTGGGGGNSGTRVNNSGNDFPGFNGNDPFSQFHHFNITPEITNTIIGVAIALACLLLVLIVVGSFARYVSETAVVRMVDQHENTGEQLTFGQGFRLGWSRAAWRMFLIDLLTSLSFIVAFIVALAIAALPALVWLTKNTPLEVLGTVLAAGLVMLVVFAAIILALALSLILLFAKRATALEDLGVIESLRRGFTIVKAHLVDLLLMGLILFGISLLWGLVMFVAFLVLIVPAAIVAGLPGLLVGAIIAVFAQGYAPWTVAAVVSALLLLITLVIPLSLVGGWYQIFSSSTWTLAYREILALDQTKQDGELPATTAA